MSLNNDYVIQALTNQRVNELHAQAANDRLARIATEGRVPWWRRLLHDSAPSVSAPSPRVEANRVQANRVQANGVPRPRRQHATAAAHHAARS
jgi:hypothetical protein